MWLIVGQTAVFGVGAGVGAGVRAGLALGGGEADPGAVVLVVGLGSVDGVSVGVPEGVATWLGVEPADSVGEPLPCAVNASRFRDTRPIPTSITTIVEAISTLPMRRRLVTGDPFNGAATDAQACMFDIRHENQMRCSALPSDRPDPADHPRVWQDSGRPEPPGPPIGIGMVTVVGRSGRW